MKRGNTKEEPAKLDDKREELANLADLERKEQQSIHSATPEDNPIILDIYISALLKVDKETARALVSGVRQGEYFRWMFDGGKVYESLHGTIDYPLSKPYPFTIKTDLRTSIGDVLWEIAQIYKTIYLPAGQLPKKGLLQNAVFSKDESENPHGVWGHGIDDLVFEMLTINKDRIKFYVGS